MWVQQEIEDFQVRKAARAWMGFLAHPGRKERLVSQILHKKMFVWFFEVMYNPM